MLFKNLSNFTGGWTKTMIVWRWKANVSKYVGQPGVVDTHFTPIMDWDGKWDADPFGRDGWVAYEEEDTKQKGQGIEAGGID